MRESLAEPLGTRARFDWRRARSLVESRLARDHIMTLGTEIGVMAASLVMLKLAAAYAGPAGFGEFVLGRRLIGFVQLPALCGMGLAVTRSVAMARASGRGAEEWRYMDAALIVTAVTSLAAVAVLVLGAPHLAAIAMGGAAMAPLARALAPGVAGLVMHGVAYGMWRGRQHMIPANVLQAINLGFIPLAVFAIPNLSVPQLLLWTGVAQLAVAITSLILIRARGPRPLPLDETWRLAGGELLRYGAPRVPGEFMLGGLNALPVMAAAYYGGSIAAGRVGLGLSLLSLITSLFAPLGQVMLPAISARIASGRTDGLARSVWQLTAGCAALTAVGVLVFEVLASWLVPAVFGSAFQAAVLPIRIIILGAIPYVLYIVLRNVLDAIHAAPLNALNLFVALSSFAIVMGLLRNGSAVAPAVLVASTVLGGLTMWRAHKALAEVTRATR